MLVTHKVTSSVCCQSNLSDSLSLLRKEFSSSHECQQLGFFSMEKYVFLFLWFVLDQGLTPILFYSLVFWILCDIFVACIWKMECLGIGMKWVWDFRREFWNALIWDFTNVPVHQCKWVWCFYIVETFNQITA